MSKNLEGRIERIEAITDPPGVTITAVWIKCHPYDREPTPEEEARLEKEARLRYPDGEIPTVEWPGPNANGGALKNGTSHTR